MFNNIYFPRVDIPSSVHAELLKVEKNKLDNELSDFYRENEFKPCSVQQPSGKPIKRLSIQFKRDKRTYPEETGNIHRTSETRRKLADGSKIQPRRQNRHLLSKRLCSRNSKLRERIDLRLERLSSSHNKDKSIRLAARLTGSRVSLPQKGESMTFSKNNYESHITNTDSRLVLVLVFFLALALLPTVQSTRGCAPL